MLEPGDRARPHRHTGAAIRFATRADGAATIVNGRRCEMKAGDLILTPPMCWHGHINESDHRIIWFDAANMPLIRAVDAHFFEPGDPRNNEFWQVDEGEERLWAEAGLRRRGRGRERRSARRNTATPAKPRAGCSRRRRPAPTGAHHPLRQSGDRRRRDADARLLRRALEQRHADAHEARDLQRRLSGGRGRRPLDHRRATFEWSQHDVFTIPHWTWARHEAKGGDADLFMVTDKSAFERLDLVREELQ